MKSYSFLAFAAVSLLITVPLSTSAADSPSPFIYESPREFFGSGDFDGDGRPDLVIVDKETGKYRLGYQSSAGVLSWVVCRPSVVKAIAGFTIGKLVTTNLDGFAFTAPDANQITLVDVSSSTAPGKPVTVPFSAALGPNTIVAIDIGGAGNSPLQDLYIGSIYNSPDANLATLIRN